MSNLNSTWGPSVTHTFGIQPRISSIVLMNRTAPREGFLIINLMLTLSSHYKVRLDRQDVRFLDRRWYRRQIGIVHRKPEFFNTSVADNIAYGKGEATLKEIVRAAKVAGAHEFILTLPHVSETSYFQTFL